MPGVAIRKSRRVIFHPIATVFFACLISCSALGQSELATVFGRVTDPSGAVIKEASVEIRNVETGVTVVRLTNSDGLYAAPSVYPGHYLISVRKAGFRTVTLTNLTLNVQDNVVRNFELQVGSAAESITVTADEATINTNDGSVSTVVGRSSDSIYRSRWRPIQREWPAPDFQLLDSRRR